MLICDEYFIVHWFLELVFAMEWSWKVLKHLQATEDLTVDKFWSAAGVWNSKPHLLIKHLMGAELLVSDTLIASSNNVFDLLSNEPASWIENPAETFQKLGLSNGEDVQVEVWKLLTKKPINWNDYLRLSVLGM